MNVHELKTWPEYFEPVWDQWKTFEIRYDDRAFQPADEVVLREFAPHVQCDCLNRRHDNTGVCAKYTGRFLTATIGHVTASTPARGNQRGFRGDGYVVFSLVNVTRGGLREGPGSQGAPDSSDAPSPVSDESLPSKGRPATTSAIVPTPTAFAERRRHARAREVLERSDDAHITVTPARVAYSTGGQS